MLLMRSDLKGRVMMSDAVSCMQLDLSGRQAKDLVHVWFLVLGSGSRLNRTFLLHGLADSLFGEDSGINFGNEEEDIATSKCSLV